MTQALSSKGGGIADLVIVRSAAILTTAYVAASSFEIEHTDQLTLLVDFTLGSSSGCRIKIEFSDDDSDYYQEDFAEWSGSDLIHAVMVHRLNATAKLPISLPVAHKYCRISAQALTTGTGTSLSIKAVRANL